MRPINATTLAAAGSLLAIAELIELIKDPEYAKRIPELIEANETILKAEDLRKEIAAFDSRVAEFDAQVAAAVVKATELNDRELALNEREGTLVAKESALSQYQADLDARQSELAQAEARLKDTVAAYVTKGNRLETELAKARTATAEANALRDEYKAKLTTLSNL
jgi:chromosome segregation ATPase